MCGEVGRLGGRQMHKNELSEVLGTEMYAFYLHYNMEGIGIMLIILFLYILHYGLFHNKPSSVNTVH